MNSSINYNQVGNATDFLAYTNNTNSSNVAVSKQQYYNQNLINGGNNLNNFQHQNEIDFQINYHAPQPPQATYNCGLSNEYLPYYSNHETSTQSATQQTHQSNSYDFLPMSVASTPVISTSSSNTSTSLNGSNASSISPSVYPNQTNDSINQLQKKLRNSVKSEIPKKEKSFNKIDNWDVGDSDDDEEDDDDEDEEDDEEDEEDEDTDTDDLNNNYFIGSKRMNSKKNSKATAMSALNADNDNENDYEIKHNCLTEDGVYLNTLFNSPSSLSSISSSNNSKEANKPLSNKKRNVNSKIKLNGKKANVIITKSENLDESEHQQNKIQQFTDSIHNKATLSSSLNSSRSSSLDDSNEANSSIQKTQQHMSNMINSYSLAGIMNDYDLVNLPLRELNKRLRFLPKQMAYNMKKRRRTLKNRKYAQNCRSKRLEQKSEMEIQNSQLKVEINRLNKLIEKLQTENVSLKGFLSTNNKIHTESGENNKNVLISLNSASMQSSANTFNQAPITAIANGGCSPQTTTCSGNSTSQLTHLLSLPLLKSDSAASTMSLNNRHTSINAHFM